MKSFVMPTIGVLSTWPPTWLPTWYCGTAHVILGKTLNKSLVGDEAPRLALVVGLLEIPPFHDLQTKESHKVVRDRKHFHKHLLTVISRSAPTHLLIGYNQVIGKGHIHDGRVLKQFVMYCVMRSTGIVSTPHLEDILLREAHVFISHELGLHIHIQRHQNKHKGK